VKIQLQNKKSQAIWIIIVISANLKSTEEIKIVKKPLQGQECVPRLL